MSFQPKKIVVGMSGGVDSSVVAAMLKEQGHEVIGVYMRNWVELDENGVCTSEQDYQDVVNVCEQLEIPYYALDFSKEYRERVFEKFIEDYQNGATPNPDVFCNKEIKFDLFYESALKMGADFIATGHYCRVLEKSGEFFLGKGLDKKKDQSYFLAGISQNVLGNVLFPLGELEKQEVRALAQKFELVTKDKKDSTGVCFIGERDFRKFLKNYIKSTKGVFCTPEGEQVGEHEGSCFYTLGQRKGLGLGGPGNPWYVVGKESKQNKVIVARDKDHPLLYEKELLASEEHWIGFEPPESFRCKAKIRYRQLDQDCHVQRKDGKLVVSFDQAQRAVCPRQFVVFYDNEHCLGSAIIE